MKKKRKKTPFLSHSCLSVGDALLDPVSRPFYTKLERKRERNRTVLPFHVETTSQEQHKSQQQQIARSQSFLVWIGICNKRRRATPTDRHRIKKRNWGAEAIKIYLDELAEKEQLLRATTATRRRRSRLAPWHSRRACCCCVKQPLEAQFFGSFFSMGRVFLYFPRKMKWNKEPETDDDDDFVSSSSNSIADDYLVGSAESRRAAAVDDWSNLEIGRGKKVKNSFCYNGVFTVTEQSVWRGLITGQLRE